MSTDSIIQLLSPKVSNLIAAGEVVLRPASVVKELMENAIDAGAKKISLTLLKAGTELIQVSDDGKGMSFADLALAFERHATSKVREVEDLDQIMTKGFRGEALASIAAVSVVEVKTKPDQEDKGGYIEIADAKVVKHEFCAANKGTQFKVKNLFYNTPARRKFLKSETVEFKHIVEEFLRLALVHSEIHFSLKHNGKIIHDLYPSTYKQRIIRAFGQKIDGNLIKVEDQTNIVKITGFISKTSYYRKYRGEQYFFVNQRFIKHSLFHHAVISSYEGVIPEKQIPSYFILLEVDPRQIDINVHPQKTEVLFENERIIYEMIKTVIKKALGHFQVDLSFDKDPTLNSSTQSAPIIPPQIKVDDSFNPFETLQKKTYRPSGERKSMATFDKWQTEQMRVQSIPPQVHSLESSVQMPLKTKYVYPPMQWQRKYIILVGEAEIELIHLRRLLTELVYRQLIDSAKESTQRVLGSSQRLIFDLVLSLSKKELCYLEGMENQMFDLGFEWTIDLEGEQLVIHAKPTKVTEVDLKEYIETLISFEENTPELNQKVIQAIAKHMPVQIESNIALEVLNQWVDKVDKESINQRFDGKLIRKKLSSLTQLNQIF